MIETRSRNALGLALLLILLLAGSFVFCEAQKAFGATCDVHISAPADLQGRLNQAGPGKTVCLSGTFKTSTGGIRPLANQTIVGGTLQYTGSYNLCRTSPTCHMTDGYELSAYGVRLQSVEVRDFEGKGVRCGDHSVIRDSYVHDNRQNGISCWADSEDWHLVITGNRIIHNGSPALEYNAAAGLKLLQLSKPGHCLGCGATVNNNVASDNFGNGLWFDRTANGIIANANTTNANTHFGMRCEKCGGPVTWTGNTASNNDFANYSLRNSAVVTMTRNASAGADIGLYIGYASKDTKTYPNLGDVTQGYHPYRIVIEDRGLIRDGIGGCDIRNVTCRA